MCLPNSTWMKVERKKKKIWKQKRDCYVFSIFGAHCFRLIEKIAFDLRLINKLKFDCIHIFFRNSFGLCVYVCNFFSLFLLYSFEKFFSGENVIGFYDVRWRFVLWIIFLVFKPNKLGKMEYFAFRLRQNNMKIWHRKYFRPQSSDNKK